MGKLGLLGTVGLIAGAAYAARQATRRGRQIDFGGRVALVTGGSRGLGLILARQLVGQGGRVAICARDEAELNRAKADLQARGGDVLAVQCDVTVKPQVDELIRGVIGHFGQLDVLINNAGVIQVAPMEEMTLADYQEAMQTHFFGPLYTTLAALPVMRGRRQGRIVNISSIGGKVPAPHLLPYTASKFALVGFSQGLRAELAKDNIFVTTVAPGLFRSGSPRNATFKGRHHEEYAWFSTADATPGLSIDPNVLAERILNAARYGQAELITPLPAWIGARLNGLFPGLIAELASLANGFLPKPGGIGSRRAKGYESNSGFVPRYAADINTSAARANNEIG
ncbi:MAG: SDR family oxidoreductase [Planctomycetota bacterium]|nr:SDR family oxidoreductase [Planctomycetota bacterium]